MSSGLLFTIIAEIEAKSLTLLSASDLTGEMERLSDGIKSKLSTNALSQENLSLFVSVSLALGFCGGLINREIASRKETKILNGAAYLLMDRLSEQIALKASAEYLYNEIRNQSEKQSTKLKARMSCLVQGARALIVNTAELPTVVAEFARFGTVAGRMISQIEMVGEKNGLTEGIEAHVMALAA